MGPFSEEIHQMMLEDLDYLESIENIIRTQEVNAEFAVATTADNFQKMFAAMDDAYMQGRAADVKDVSERVLDILCGVSAGMGEMNEPCIIAADDLAPSETVQLDKSKVLGFATMYGSSNSHTAILARTMNIPAVIGLGENLLQEYDGRDAIIDGFTGTLYIDPEHFLHRRTSAPKIWSRKRSLSSSKEKRMLPRAGRKSMSMPISVMSRMWVRSSRMMQEASVFSEVSSFILRIPISRQKNSSFLSISRLRRIWRERRSLSVHLT